MNLLSSEAGVAGLGVGLGRGPGLGVAWVGLRLGQEEVDVAELVP
jgi:hypothetical protein